LTDGLLEYISHITMGYLEYLLGFFVIIVGFYEFTHKCENYTR